MPSHCGGQLQHLWPPGRISPAGSQEQRPCLPLRYFSGRSVDSPECSFPLLLEGCHQRDRSLRPETPENVTCCRDKLLCFLRSQRPCPWHPPSSVTMTTTLFLSHWPRAQTPTTKFLAIPALMDHRLPHCMSSGSPSVQFSRPLHGNSAAFPRCTSHSSGLSKLRPQTAWTAQLLPWRPNAGVQGNRTPVPPRLTLQGPGLLSCCHRDRQCLHDN